MAGTKNKLSDLNDILFAQLERLNEEDITMTLLGQEIQRADAINGIANNIVQNAKVQLEATKILLNHGGMDSRASMPKIFELNENANPKK